MTKNFKKGFTLVELVIVIAVVAVLAAVLIPTFVGIIERANESTRIQAVTSARDEYFSANENLVSTDQLNGYLFVIDGNIYKIEDGQVVNANDSVDLSVVELNGNSVGESVISNSGITIYEPIAEIPADNGQGGETSGNVDEEEEEEEEIVQVELPFIFSIYNNEATITGYIGEIPSTITIPDYIDCSLGIRSIELSFTDYDEFLNTLSGMFYSYDTTVSVDFVRNGNASSRTLRQWDMWEYNSMDYDYYKNYYTSYVIHSEIEIYCSGRKNIPVTGISSNAFAGATNLQHINLGNASNLTNVPADLYSSCPNLQCNYDEDNNARYIGTATNPYYLLAGVDDKTAETITVNSNTVVVADRAFFECQATTIDFGENSHVKELNESVFARCNNLQTLVIPSSVEYIGYSCFAHCGITNLIFEDGSQLKELAYGAFYDANSIVPTTDTSTGIKYLTTPSNPYFLMYSNSSSSISGTVTVRKETKLLSQGAIIGSGVTAINFEEGSNLEYIAEIGISGTNISVLNLPDSLLCIADQAIYCNSNLREVYIPKSVVKIGRNPIACNNLNCTHNVEKIVVDSENRYYDSRENCNAIIETKTNKLIQGSINTVIPSSVKVIGNSAFYYLSITNITLNEGLVEIEQQAFGRCGSLTSINIPSTVVKIGSYTFMACDSLTSITFADSEDWYVINEDSGGTEEAIDVSESYDNVELLKDDYLYYVLKKVTD